MRILEKKLWKEPKTEADKKVILLVSDNTRRRYNVGVMTANPTMNIDEALYVFPYMVSEEKARKTFEELRNELK
jgi:hypothetical protein